MGLRAAADERYIRVLQTVIDLATDHVLVTDRDGVLLFVGSASASAFGIDQEASIGHTVTQAGVPAAIAQRLEADWHRVLSYGELSCAGFTLDSDPISEGPREFEYACAPVCDDRGRVEAVITTLHDVEDRRRIQQNLRDSETRFRLLAETLPQLVWIAGPDGTLEYANRRWCDFTGLPLSRVLQGAWFTAVPDQDCGVMQAAWDMAHKTGEAFEVELRLKAATGKFRWFLVRGEPMKGDAGKVVQWFGTCTDIDGQKRQLQEQRFFAELSDRMRTTLDPELVLWEAVAAIGEHLAVSRCNYAEIDAERELVIIHKDYCRGVQSHVGSYPLGGFGGDVIEDIRRGNTVVIDDTEHDIRTRDTYEEGYAKLAIRAFVAVPLLQKGRWAGVLSVHQAEAREWEKDEIELLETVAERTWLAWDNANLIRASLDVESRQKAFVRDILASVTEGKLVLCHDAAELPTCLSDASPAIEISEAEGMAGIRNRAREYASKLRFDMGRTYDLITALGEA